MSIEHPFAKYVRILGKGKQGSRSLTAEEAYDAMAMILRNEVMDVQLGAFLMLLRVKEETDAELYGFIRAAKDFIKQSITSPLLNDLDWPSYSGKHKHLPWYLLSAILLSQHKISVFMHGASGHTEGRLYTENVLQHLGITPCQSVDQARQKIASEHFAYLPLRAFCPKLHDIIDLRNTMGLRSPVHTMARLLNPSNAKHVLLGIFHPSYRPVHQDAALALGYSNISVFKGEAGEVERKPDARCLVQRVVRDNIGEAKKIDQEWPPLMDVRQDKETELKVQTLIDVWQGKISHTYGENAIIGTTAIALQNLGKADTIEQSLGLASKLWQQRELKLFS